MLNPKQKLFCEHFARLFKDAVVRGERPRVGRKAALYAGYGQGSWSEINVILTADSMYQKLIRRRDVRDYLKELGLEHDGQHWRIAG